MYRVLVALLATFAVLTASSSMADNPPSDRIHEFKLIVTSLDGGYLPIEGSIAFDADQPGYVHISGATPYEVTVEGRGYLAVISSTDENRRFLAVLEVDGSPASRSADRGDRIMILGRDLPRPKTGFATSL